MLFYQHPQKREYLWKEKGIPKKENAIFLYFEKPFKLTAIIFLSS